MGSIVFDPSVRPVVYRKGSREGQSKTSLSSMSVVMERIEIRLKEKRTAAGRPDDLRVWVKTRYNIFILVQVHLHIAFTECCCIFVHLCMYVYQRK